MEDGIYGRDHQDFRESVQEFLRREAWPRADEMVAERAIPRALWLAAGEQGYLGLSVRRSTVASARGTTGNAVLLEELAKVSMALASSLSIHFDVVAPYLVTLTDQGGRHRDVALASDGQTVTAIAMTEPSGSTWRPSGPPPTWGRAGRPTATFITSNGASADLLVVAAHHARQPQVPRHHAVRDRRLGQRVLEGVQVDKVGQPDDPELLLP